MHEVSDVNIGNLAKLARLELSSDQQLEFAKQLPQVLDFVGELEKVNVDSTEEVAAVPLTSLRDDTESGAKLSLDQLESLAPRWENSQLVVPPVFDEVDNA